MEPKRLDYLMEQHRLNRLSPQEEAELDSWYDELDDPSVKPMYVEGTPEAKEYVAGHTQQIMDRIAHRERRRVLHMWMKVAAVLIAGLIITYLVWPEGQNRTGKEIAITTDPAAYTRYLTLPDSSTVILGEGSTLQLVEGFGKANRTLTLEGEAYFDVRHNTALPFVIHTGKITTTVLGTAFNIKQQGDSVAVTVTRGRVQVAYEDKILAQITPGKQFTADQHNRIAQTTEPAVATVTAWMQNGLHFENATLGEAVEQLENRFNTSIDLRTPGIEYCRMTMTTPFSGTERLETILEVIATTLGAQYSNYNGTIEITGQPCPANKQ